VGVRAARRRDSARRDSLAHARAGAAVAAEDRGRCGTSPSCHPCVLVGAVAIGDASLRGDDFLGWLLLGIEGLLSLRCARSWPGNERFPVALSCAWWWCCGGLRPSGYIVFAEYVAMIIFSGAARAEHGFPDETPAGTGYLTVATITVSAISAILTAIVTLRTPQGGTMRLHRTRIQRSLTLPCATSRLWSTSLARRVRRRK
jgi:hypothetical protein